MKLLRLLPSFVVSLGILACNQSNTPSVTTIVQAPIVATPVTPKKQIGLVMKTLTNPFFVEMEKGARRAEKEIGIVLKVKTAAQETSIEQQIQLVEDLIADKVDAIVIAPGDSQRLVPALKKAAEAGIKVINIDNRLDQETVAQAGMKPIPFVSVDNEAGAYKVGQFLVKGITKPTELAVLEGIRSADNAKQRAQGARKAFLENKHVKLVASESANWKIDEGYSVTKEIFTKHPNISLIFAANDMMAIGAIKFLQESGKPQVKVAGYDALDEALTEINSGRMLATIDQQAAEQGYQGIALANRLAHGSTVPEVTLIDTRLISAKAKP
jgi:ribose transport system substrate-binding protein